MGRTQFRFRHAGLVHNVQEDGPGFVTIWMDCRYFCYFGQLLPAANNVNRLVSGWALRFFRAKWLLLYA
jgi:hypothetical protein